ncbi:MAG: mobilization protein [Pseudomonadota bacterium]
MSMEQQLKALKERHSNSEAKRKRDEAKMAKIAATRRAVLAGTIVIDAVQNGEIHEAQFRKWLDGGLTNSDDRALFGL